MLEVRPLVVADGIVLGGNMRLLVMKDLGYREVYAIDVTEWTQGQRDEFMIKDNLSFGDWNYDFLANEWEGTDLTEWGMDVWDTELDDFSGLSDEDDVPEAPEEPITKLGDVWILGEHRVMCGDSTSKEAVEILMDGEKADMVFADPPYNALKSWKKDEAKGETRLDPSQWFANDNLSWKEFDDFIKKTFSNFDGHSIYVCCDYRIYPILRKIGRASCRERV